MSGSTSYVKAAPEFTDLDTEVDGERFTQAIRVKVGESKPAELVIDISECFLDYWGCAKVVEGAMDLLRGSEGSNLNTLAFLTTMDFGMRKSYASLLFKGTRFEKDSKDFIAIAISACKEMNLELRIWIVPSKGFVYEGLSRLKQPNYILSSK